jgi:NAD(P)-dependent dehydrogenase (short-subunit alcohol dehydrogenase family)
MASTSAPPPSAACAAAAETPSPRPVCLVTGAAGGIGAACVRAFADGGWHVGIAHLPGEAAEAAALAAECAAGTTLLLPLDITDDAACRAAAARAQARWGRIDALVQCAGTTRFVPHADLDGLDAAEFHRTYGVNVVGMYQMARACAPVLAAAPGQGAIVNISSIGGLLGRGSSIAYAASKGAVNTMTVALARALAPSVRVNAIAPGFVAGGLPQRVLAADALARVEAAQTAAAPLQRVSQPSEVAALAFFLATAAPGMTGEVLMMDNGLHLNAG